MASETRKMRASDLVLRAGDLMLAESSVVERGTDGVAFTPVKLVVRTDSGVGTWRGSMVHDLSGCFHNAKVPLDWVHDDDHPSDIIGYLDSVDKSNSAIKCSGMIVSLEEMDIADQVVKRLKAGIPFESSISFGGQGLVIEEVSEDASVEVNGTKLKGPALVVRKWPLRGVAVCPHGADNSTSTSLALSEQEVSVLVTSKEVEQMADENGTPVPDVKAIVPEEKKLAEGVVVVPPEVAVEKKGTDFLTAFGTDGAVWFAEGKTFSEAQLLYLKKLEDTNKILSDKLAALGSLGDRAELSLDDGDSERTARIVDLSTKIGPKLAKFAAELKIPK